MIYQDGLLTMDDPPPAPAAVPEPSTLFIIGAALILAYLAHRWLKRVAHDRRHGRVVVGNHWQQDTTRADAHLQ